MTVKSRFFGEIDLGAVRTWDGGAPAAETTIESGRGEEVQARLAVTDPSQLRQQQIDQADMALEVFDALDQRTRAAISAVMDDEGSVPRRVYTMRTEVDPGRPLSPEQFVETLRVASVSIRPDGPMPSPDRITLDYVSSGRVVEQTFRVVVRDGGGVSFLAEDDLPAPASGSALRW